MPRYHDDEDDDDDDRRGHRRPTVYTIGHVARIVAVVAWSLLLAAVFVGGIVFLTGLNRTASAIQDAALAAVTAATFVGLYVAARCVAEIAAYIDRASPDTRKRVNP